MGVRLSFGVASAPFLFSRITALAFVISLRKMDSYLVYMDDVVSCSSTWESHLTLLEHIIKSLPTAGLTLEPSGVQLGPREVKYLGHKLSPDGIRLGTDRVEAIVDLPKPTNIKELRSVLGMVNFICKPMPNLTAQ